ncbi:MAG: exonuclease domain-containing protein [Candidatus Omnitrophota bacterium]|nr:WYL domain-containing protein [Candidatus Omnitrophota bacterium]
MINGIDIDEIEFTIIDTETTGLDPQRGDRIIELAGLRFKGKEKLAVFNTLINPGRPVSEAAYLVNQISFSMLERAPRIEKVLPGFLSFIQGSCLCCYNAAFDLGFINQELKLSGYALPEDAVAIDLLEMAKRLLPGLERYALWFVAKKLGIDKGQSHRAFSDVELSFDVFQRLKDILKSKKLSDPAYIFALFGCNSSALKDMHKQKLARIQEAIDLGVNIKIQYLSSQGVEISLREVTPRQIKQQGRNFYLIGYCFLRKQERTFRVDSILQLEIMGKE